MVGDGAVVTWTGLAVSLLLVGVAAALSVALHLRLEQQVLVAAARALVQLLLVGAALELVIDPDRSLLWSWLWVAAMVVYAAGVASRRAPQVPGLRLVALIAFGAAAVVTLGVLFGLGVFPLEGRTLVPLGGMMVGNSMAATVLAARRVLEEATDKRAEIEARLALGQDSRTAMRPHLRSALRSAITPQVETTKATGLVFLPGAMVGLILAGVEPVDAVLV
ncbi:MAG: ABC transporter permease, partial [Nocardioidaceae bacterium]|nr:ABC transporter permease [Nocardioidaceae bacterium]